MARLKIRVISKLAASKQNKAGNWIPTVRLKFSIPKLSYRDEIEIRKNKYSWNKARGEIKKKLIKHLKETFIPIEYEEEV